MDFFSLFKNILSKDTDKIAKMLYDDDIENTGVDLVSGIVNFTWEKWEKLKVSSIVESNFFPVYLTTKLNSLSHFRNLLF